jgi:hypothetical protein
VSEGCLTVEVLLGGNVRGCFLLRRTFEKNGRELLVRGKRVLFYVLRTFMLRSK